jgi:hypothetical protein
MKVTDQARCAALLRALYLNGLRSAGDRVPARAIESTWAREVGLRRVDMISALERFRDLDFLVPVESGSGPMLELRENFDDAALAGSSLWGRLTSARVLARAQRRALRLFETAPRQRGEERRRGWGRNAGDPAPLILPEGTRQLRKTSA